MCVIRRAPLAILGLLDVTKPEPQINSLSSPTASPTVELAPVTFRVRQPTSFQLCNQTGKSSWLQSKCFRIKLWTLQLWQISSVLLRRTLAIHPCKQDQLYPVFPISPLLNGLVIPPVSTLTSPFCHGKPDFLSFSLAFSGDTSNSWPNSETLCEILTNNSQLKKKKKKCFFLPRCSAAALRLRIPVMMIAFADL